MMLLTMLLSSFFFPPSVEVWIKVWKVSNVMENEPKCNEKTKFGTHFDCKYQSF